MPKLTRRRYPERQDCWHIYFGDVHVGTIARRVGQAPAKGAGAGGKSLGPLHAEHAIRHTPKLNPDSGCCLFDSRQWPVWYWPEGSTQICGSLSGT
jgi:hypothetical protein